MPVQYQNIRTLFASHYYFIDKNCTHISSYIYSACYNPDDSRTYHFTKHFYKF